MDRTGESDGRPNCLVASLLSVAKELQKKAFIQEFKREFENEEPTEISPSKKRKLESEDATAADKSSNSKEDELDLRMEVFEDKDYDVEEVKFWNFISKSKGTKPNLIRTFVYKVPEATYVVKKSKVPASKSPSAKSAKPN